MPDEAVPSQRRPDDPRCTRGLALDVTNVLEEHGYEPVNGGQFVELQQHLFHFLHGDPAGRCDGGAR
jgi:hypothetical protein